MLSECESVHGGHLLVAEDPPIREADNVSFYPGTRGATELFHSNGRAVPEAVIYMGLDGPNAPQGVLQRLPEPLADAPRGFDYIFAGSLQEHHYGHFLLDGLPRFWSLPLVVGETTRFVYSGPSSPEDLFRVPYVAAIYGALGLRPEQFVRFPEGARFERITVPALSFEENNLGHLAYARLCHRVGHGLTKNQPPVAPDRRPLYLSKHKVARGVSRVVNEAELVDELIRLGADVVCPETLTLAAQVRLWRDRTVIYGIGGSAFHTAIFVPRSRAIILDHGSKVWSNQLILDWLNQGDVDHCYAPSGMTNKGRDGAFHNNFVLADPIGVARALLDRALMACEA
nr:glycosyltransferase family 61 protein [uncultured Lichenicoccus sp.]